MLLHSSDHLCGTLALADHAGLTLSDHSGAVGVHTVSGGGTGRADSFAGTGGGGAHKVDDAVLNIHGQFLALGDQLTQALVGSIASSVDHAGDQAAVTGLQCANFLTGQRCLNRNRHIKEPPFHVLPHGS